LPAPVFAVGEAGASSGQALGRKNFSQDEKIYPLPLVFFQIEGIMVSRLRVLRDQNL